MTEPSSLQQNPQLLGLEKDLNDLKDVFGEIEKLIGETDVALNGLDTQLRQESQVSTPTQVSQIQKTVRGRMCNARTVAAVTGYLLLMGFVISGLVLAILNGESSLTTGLMVGGSVGIAIETLVLLVLKYRAKRAENLKN